jgi:hypothetical protein
VCDADDEELRASVRQRLLHTVGALKKLEAEQKKVICILNHSLDDWGV